MALDEYAAYASAQFRKLSNADKWDAVKSANSGNMSALAKSLGVTRKTLYAWKRAYEGTTANGKPNGSVPRAWGRQSILSAKRLIHRLPIDIDKAVFTSGDVVVLLALIAGERDALDQLPELLREPLSKCVPSTR